ncbi:hypothetical protein B0H11DRAFT_1031984 [Mycena galericulata]|nr:hypothetical protein B0H11DRAFT_1031984 [Mycena galericulata]
MPGIRLHLRGFTALLGETRYPTRSPRTGPVLCVHHGADIAPRSRQRSAATTHCPLRTRHPQSDAPSASSRGSWSSRTPHPSPSNMDTNEPRRSRTPHAHRTRQRAPRPHVRRPPRNRSWAPRFVPSRHSSCSRTPDTPRPRLAQESPRLLLTAYAHVVSIPEKRLHLPTYLFVQLERKSLTPHCRYCSIPRPASHGRIAEPLSRADANGGGASVDHGSPMRAHLVCMSTPPDKVARLP